MNLLSPELLWGLAGAVFGAGGAVTLLRIVRRDLNGLGANQRQLERQFLVLMLTLVPEEKREWLAEILLRK